MILVEAEAHHKKAIAYLEGVLDGKPHERNLPLAEKMLNEVLNYNIGNPVILLTIALHHLSVGHYGQAISLFHHIVAMSPQFGEAWNNLGLAYKMVPDFAKSEVALKNAARFIKGEAERADIYCNLSAINITRNRPEHVIQWADKALALVPDHAKSLWHKGLALLEMRKWDEAWDLHEYRLHGGSPGEIAERNYHGPDGMTPEWDGKSPGLIVIHGEQGIGDEVMFASCIPDALKVPGTSFICEPSKRLEALFARSFPEIKFYGTNDTDGRAWIDKHGRPDFKIALGSLPKFFRRSDEAFPGTEYLVPDKAKRQWWGEKLNALPRKPNIGIAWQGGVDSTRYDARSFHPSEFAPLFAAIDANWISLQYDATAQTCVNEVKEALGVKITHWPAAVEQRNPETGKMSDVDELAALISKLDIVVSVCQTAIHISGSLGTPTLCLVPSEPSWRYGAGDSELMPWYASVKLLRQEKGTSEWRPVIERAAKELTELFADIRAAAQ